MFTNYRLSCFLSFLATLLGVLFSTVANAEEQPVAVDGLEQAGPTAKKRPLVIGRELGISEPLSCVIFYCAS